MTEVYLLHIVEEDGDDDYMVFRSGNDAIAEVRRMIDDISALFVNHPELRVPWSDDFAETLRSGEWFDYDGGVFRARIVPLEVV